MATATWASSLRLTDKAVVLGMSADPEPKNSFRHGDTQRTVVISYTNAAEFSVFHHLKMQRRMLRILPEQCILPAGKLLNVARKGIEAAPKAA